MSELFDSLNLSNSAGPSSSQQSSSQPSTSKVFWHASPSPGVLRQLCNWTPSKSQDSPTLPLCTQAFVGELKKLPNVFQDQSPLISRDSAKRKLTNSARLSASDATPFKGKRRAPIVLELSDDDEEESSDPKRLLLGDAGESSPESRRRRTMDAGLTGRMRDPASPSQAHSSSSRGAALPQLETLSSRRADRRPSRRRKKESFMAGLGFTDDSGRPSDCLKLFEDLQAAIQGIQAPRMVSVGGSTPTDQRPTVTFDRASAEGGRLTPREGINRTSSAPTPTRAVHQQDRVSGPARTQKEDEEVQPRRVFRPVKSDHDVFRAGQIDRDSRALQPRPTNVPKQIPSQIAIDLTKEPAQEALSQHNQSQPKQHERVSPARSVPPPAAPEPAPAPTEAPQARQPSPLKPLTSVAPPAYPSPIKRSARIEAMQQTHNSVGKKLGVRGPSMLSKSTTSSPRKPLASSTATPARKVGGSTAARTRTNPLPGMSQARQVGLPRSSSQYAPTQSQHMGPAAPFRPPAIAARHNHTVRTSPTKVAKRDRGGQAQPASSDDSFGDDDDAFLALACELEY